MMRYETIMKDSKVKNFLLAWIKCMFTFTVSKAIDAVSPEVSMAKTAGSGLATGITCLEGT